MITPHLYKKLSSGLMMDGKLFKKTAVQRKSKLTLGMHQSIVTIDCRIHVKRADQKEFDSQGVGDRKIQAKEVPDAFPPRLDVKVSRGHAIKHRAKSKVLQRIAVAATKGAHSAFNMKAC